MLHWFNKGNNMRKIEQQMIAALREHRDWQSGNTAVTENGNVSLHGNRIAEFVNIGSECMVTFAGRKTRTTASRLRAIINAFGYKPVDGFQASTRNNGVQAGATYLMKR